MRSFSRLYADIDATTATSAKVQAMVRHLQSMPDAEAAWAVYFLAGGKPRQLVPSKVLRQLACDLSGVPDWLFEESYQAVGDLAETIAHLLPPPTCSDDAGLDVWMTERLLPLRGQPPDQAAEAVRHYWTLLEAPERFLLNKLMTGGLRVGVARGLVQRALAGLSGLDPALLAQRMMGYTDDRHLPEAARYRALLTPRAAASLKPAGAHATATHAADAPTAAAITPEAGTDGHPAAACVIDTDGRPYPFFLAHPLQDEPAALGDRDDWQAEYKWDGIRAQVVRRDGQVFIWSRGEELVTERYPEVVSQALTWPDGTVLDGEILAWKSGGADLGIVDLPGRPAEFAALQTRIGRQRLGPRQLQAAPVRFLAYDLLEWQGVDQRAQPLQARRSILESLRGRVACSPVLTAPTWEALQAVQRDARSHAAEGLMLKRRNAPYGVGRSKASRVGEWWKWKVEPFAVDAVLVYAQRGHGRRASLYTDYTFAVWDTQASPPRLVPFAKAYSGLSDVEIKAVDSIIRRSTIEQFGPVRSVTPSIVCEIGFEGIQASPRHKSGIAVRFPRMLRWRQDKPVQEADSLLSLRQILDSTR